MYCTHFPLLSSSPQPVFLVRGGTTGGAFVRVDELEPTDAEFSKSSLNL